MRKGSEEEREGKRGRGKREGGVERGREGEGGEEREGGGREREGEGEKEDKWSTEMRPVVFSFFDSLFSFFHPFPTAAERGR